MRGKKQQEAPQEQPKQEEREFNRVNGFIPKDRHEKSPTFILCTVSIKIDEFIEFLNRQPQEEEWLNLEIKRSKKGKIYAEKSNFKPKPKE